MLKEILDDFYISTYESLANRGNSFLIDVIDPNVTAIQDILNALSLECLDRHVQQYLPVIIHDVGITFLLLK